MDALEDEMVDQASLGGSRLRPLLLKRDGPGLLRIVVQLAMLGLLLYGTVNLAAAHHRAWILTMFGAGLVLPGLFAAEHEAGHRTAFRTGWLNDLVLWICAPLMLQAPTFFREFHWQHHRATQDRALDPEISGAPDLLDDWPRHPLAYAALAAGQLLLIGKALFTFAGALLPTAAAWEKAFPFIRPNKRTRIAWESRAVIVGWVAVITAGVAYVPGFAFALLAWPIGHVALGSYLMAEHTGLPHEGSQNHRTRTVISTPLVRWMMWNMPYHAVHHMHPAVPFHAIPTAQAIVAPSLEHVSSGYLAFHREALRHAFGRSGTEPVRPR